MSPFIDHLFGGKLLSAVVCEGCKHVSHNYEDFLDLSLAVRPELEAKGRKRDRIAKMADKWRRSASKPPARPRSAAETPRAQQRLQEHQISDAEAELSAASRPSRAAEIVRPKSAMLRSKKSEGHLNDTSSTPPGDEIKTNGSIQQTALEGERSSAEGRATPVPDHAAMKLAPDFAAYTDAERAFVRPSEGYIGANLLRAVSGRRPKTPASASRSASPCGVEGRPRADHDADTKGLAKKGQQTRQSQYTTRLFSDLPKPDTSSHAGSFWGRWASGASHVAPVTSSVADVAVAAATSAAHSRASAPAASSASEQVPPQDILATQQNTDLVKSLTAFCAVEALEGENLYSCKRCWRLSHPPTPAERLRHIRKRTRRGESCDESEKSSDNEASDTDAAATARVDELASSIEGLSVASAPSSDRSGAASKHLQASSVAVDLASDVAATQTITPRTGAALAEAAARSAIAESSMLGDHHAEIEEFQNITSTIDTPSRSIPIIETTSPKSTSDEHSAGWSKARPGLQAPQPIRKLAADADGLSDDCLTSDDEALRASGASETDLSSTSGARTVDSAAAASISDVDVPNRAPSVSFAADVPAPNQRRRSTQSVARRALKRYLIASTPPVLVVHFKRFQHNRSFGFGSLAGGSKKIDDFISIPEWLDLSPFLAPPREEYDRHGRLKASSDPRALRAAEKSELSERSDDKRQVKWHWPSRHQDKHQDGARSATEDGKPRTKYRLYAVVVHEGTMTSGHYTAFVKAPLPKASAESAPASAAVPATAVSDSDLPTPTKADGEESDLPVEALTSKDASDDSPRATSVAQEAPSEVSPHTSAATTSSASSSLASLQLTPAESGSNSTAASSSRSSASKASAPAPSGPSQYSAEERHWLYTSDTFVRPASLEEVLRAKVYIAFYERV